MEIVNRYHKKDAKTRWNLNKTKNENSRIYMKHTKSIHTHTCNAENHWKSITRWCTQPSMLSFFWHLPSCNVITLKRGASCIPPCVHKLVAVKPVKRIRTFTLGRIEKCRAKGHAKSVFESFFFVWQRQKYTFIAIGQRRRLKWGANQQKKV